MKKRTCKIMALLLACSMMAGCGSKPQDTSKDAQEAEESAQETKESSTEESAPEAESDSDAGQEAEQPASGETVNIKWYVFTSEDNPDKAKVEAAINEYIEPRKIGRAS